MDLAHHYALVVRISEHHLFGGLDDPSLGEMNYYPRLAHMLAALMGVVLGSNFLGMQLLTMLALSLIWCSTLSMISTLERRLALVSCLFVAIMMALNIAFFKLEVHGHEVIANYFFSQLVAQAIVVFALAIALKLDYKARPMLLYIFMLVAVYVTTSIHLLPALLLVAVFVGILALAVLNAYIVRTGLVKSLLAFFLFSVLSLCAVFLNPAFSAMRKISENNGALSFKHISYPVGLFTVCALVIVLSAYFIYLSIKNKDSSFLFFKYFGLYGLAQASICLLQMALAKLGIGSDYAVKKYGFGLFTFLLVATAVIFARWSLARTRMSPFFCMGCTGLRAELYILFVFLVVLFFAFPLKKDLDVRPIVGLERNISQLLSAVPLSQGGRAPVIVDLDGVSQQFNYMFSIALAKTNRALAIPDVLIANELRDPSQYSYVISSLSSSRYALSACQVRADNGLAVSDSSCISEHLVKASECTGTAILSDKGNIAATRLTGFSHGEPDGRWMSATINTFKCSMHSKQPKNAQVVLVPFFAEGVNEQRIRLLINDVPVKELRFLPGEPIAPIDIQLPFIPAGTDLIMTFNTPDAISPKALGLSEDPRTLSFYVRTIRFY